MDNNKNKVIKDSEIPKYTKGGGDYKNTFVLVGENKNEVIIDKNGNLRTLESIKNSSYTAEDLVKASKRLKDLAPTFKEAAVAFNNFGKALKEAEEKGLLKQIT